MKRIILAMALSIGLFSAAEARQRAYAVHPECNVTMPCEGVTTSQRGERVVKAMGGFGVAKRTYTPRVAALHPPRYRTDTDKAKARIVDRIIVAAARVVPSITDFSATKAAVGPRPGAWCGWFMQHDTGVTSKATGLNLNRAIEWRRVGQPTSPQVGAIVVWPHHVGRIVGGQPGAWVVRSGNDGRGQVRERVRADLGRAVAFRQI